MGFGVGDGVGLSVGGAVGLAVGLGVGLAVGLGVGDGVGLAVGLGVGDAVGIGVGLGVGDGVGLGVGELLPSDELPVPSLRSIGSASPSSKVVNGSSSDHASSSEDGRPLASPPASQSDKSRNLAAMLIAKGQKGNLLPRSRDSLAQRLSHTEKERSFLVSRPQLHSLMDDPCRTHAQAPFSGGQGGSNVP